MSHQDRGISSKFLIKDNLSPADYLDVMDTIVSVEFLSGIYVIVTAKDEKSPLVLPFDRDPVLKYNSGIGRNITAGYRFLFSGATLRLRYLKSIPDKNGEHNKSVSVP